MKSIRLKGMLFALSLLFLTISVFGISTYYRSKKIIMNEINRSVERIAEETADHLSFYIDRFLSPLLELSQNINIISMERDKQNEVINAQINPYYLNVAVVDLNGQAYYTDNTNLDLSDREYVQEALKGKISFSEVILSRKTGDNVIMVAVPIKRNAEIIGALIARLDVNFISDFALTEGYGAYGRSYVISTKGSFISQKYLEDKGDHYNLFDLEVYQPEYSDFSGFVKQNIENPLGHGKFTYNNRSILMGYASVKGTNWKIYIGTYEEEALKSLTGLKNMMFIGMAIVLVLGALSAWFVVKTFSKPIVELDRILSQGATGDLTIRFTPKTKDEIGRVGQSFNRMMDKIKTLTQYDPLTELYNQYVLKKQIDFCMNSEIETDFTLIMISINNFSFVNETHGYTTGDAILCQVANRIINCVTKQYQVFRYKGDEFVVYGNANDVNINDSINIANKVLSNLEPSYSIEDKLIEIKFSLGIFIWNKDTRNEEPLKAVTHANNYAKYLGRNQVHQYDLKTYHNVLLKRELQVDITKGLQEDQFFMVYQPLYYLHSETIAEVEALIRWDHPERGVLYPDQFIELAEQSSLIIQMDFWVIKTICKQLHQWAQNNKKPIMISINISSKTFETKHFVTDLLEIIEQYSVKTNLIQLEITERMVIKNVEESILKLNLLRTMGIKVAIDDFGIGYSSLSYIVKLPIDCIKIDKTFVQNISTSIEAKAIVTTIINLCKSLKLNVIAEGIESEIELDYLKDNHCDIGQGYYYSKPVSIEEIEIIS